MRASERTQYFIAGVILFFAFFTAFSGVIHGFGTRSKCTDSDGGINIYTAGEIVVITGGDTYVHEDICLGTNVLEYYCTTKGTAEVESRPCSYICRDGACVSS